ncbi:MAG TPA: hypothetical protein VH062_20005 [Polyangiaceae bacterium]|nr:hypothetical protein [Polyangiaceae bacterium]
MASRAQIARSPAPAQRAPTGSYVRDEPVKTDVHPEEAFRALMKVDPDCEPVEDNDRD